MKHLWKRQRPVVALTLAQLGELVRPIAPEGAQAATSCSIGMLNTLYRVQVKSGPVCVKLNQRGRREAEVEHFAGASMAARLGGPAHLHFCPSNAFTGDPISITE